MSQNNNSIIPPLLSPDLTYTLPFNGSSRPAGLPQTLCQVMGAISGNQSSVTAADLNKSGTGVPPENPGSAVKTGNSYPIADVSGKTFKPIEDGKYTVTSRMSAARTLNGVTKAHKGIDLSAKEGTPIHAVQDGTIVGIQTEAHKDARGMPLRNPDGSIKTKGYGQYVTVKHADGTMTRYAHLSSYNKNPDFKVGQKIGAGTVIGEVGHTGRSVGRTGDHLHFELRDSSGKPISPNKFIE